jgi:hypothetical protein
VAFAAFPAPQAGSALTPCLAHCSALLRLFSAPEVREKSPEKGACHWGRFRGPCAPPGPKGGCGGAEKLAGGNKSLLGAARC